MHKDMEDTGIELNDLDDDFDDFDDDLEDDNDDDNDDSEEDVTELSLKEITEGIVSEIAVFMEEDRKLLDLLKEEVEGLKKAVNKLTSSFGVITDVKEPTGVKSRKPKQAGRPEKVPPKIRVPKKKSKVSKKSVKKKISKTRR